MPSIIPALPPAPSIANVSGTLLVDSSIKTASDDIYFGVNLNTLLVFDQPGGQSITFTNGGTLWLDHNSGPNFGSPVLIYGLNMGALVNAGTMALISSSYIAYGIYNESSWGGFTNSGSLWVLNSSGAAVGVRSAAVNGTAQNSGLIAVSGAASSLGIWRDNGGVLNNLAGGQILVEATSQFVTGIAYGRGGTITNAGLIEVQRLGTAHTAYAIYINAGSDPTTITNSGTISSDQYAIYADSTAFSPATDGVQTITNTASGQIIGNIVLRAGDDSIVNAGAITGTIDMGHFADSLTNTGSITGAIDMGNGNDLLDTQGGSISGVISLGTGDDIFRGSALADRVMGGVMNDLLQGNGGDDLLAGGFGNDTLVGGTGNDGLYGELGDDLIQTLGGDAVFAGEGQDRIELGDLTFASVDGGSGFDTLVLPTGALSLNLALVAASGRVSAIEAIVLRGSQAVSLTSADVLALSGGAELRFQTTAGDALNLVGSWTDGGLRSVGGTSYHVYASGGREVLVSGAGSVQLGAVVPGGATGLQPVAAGAAAPVAGGASGVTLMGTNYVIEAFEGLSFSDNLRVNAGETWTGTSRITIADPTQFEIRTLDNYGTIRSASTVVGNGTVPEVVAVQTNIQGIINNHGLIETVAGYRFGVGVQIRQEGTLNNFGQILVNSDYVATGVFIQQGGGFHNTGSITAISADYAKAVEVQVGHDFVNDGTIAATGQAAIGLWISNPSDLMVNNGSIIATATTAIDPAYRSQGVILFQGYTPSTFINTGLIQAVTAIRVLPGAPGGTTRIENSGAISGGIELGEANDVVINSGTLNGTIHFGDGNDRFDSSSGIFSGVADGGFGNDSFIGGIGTDWFEGGAGNDSLDGGAGIDRALYTNALAGVTVDLRITTAQDTVGSGADILIGIEELYGSTFNDTLTGNDQANLLDGGGGIDSLSGGNGNDRLVVSAVGSGSFVDGGAQSDTLAINGTVQLGGVTGIENIELAAGSALTLTGAQVVGGFALSTAVTGSGSLIINMTAGQFLFTKPWSIASGITVTINGTSGNDVMKLGNVIQTVVAGDGADQIKGGNLVDTINGGGGIDKINGEGGADILTGGAGNDVFKYASASDSGMGAARDTITDFAIGLDRLNFVQLDANAALAGDQAFSFVGTAAFSNTGIGQIRYGTSGSDLVVQVDVDGNGTADMEVLLQGLSGQTLTGADFVL